MPAAMPVAKLVVETQTVQDGKVDIDSTTVILVIAFGSASVAIVHMMVNCKTAPRLLPLPLLAAIIADDAAAATNEVGHSTNGASTLLQTLLEHTRQCSVEALAAAGAAGAA